MPMYVISDVTTEHTKIHTYAYSKTPMQWRTKKCACLMYLLFIYMMLLCRHRAIYFRCKQWMFLFPITGHTLAHAKKDHVTLPQKKQKAIVWSELNKHATGHERPVLPCCRAADG